MGFIKWMEALEERPPPADADQIIEQMRGESQQLITQFTTLSDHFKIFTTLMGNVTDCLFNIGQGLSEWGEIETNSIDVLNGVGSLNRLLESEQANHSCPNVISRTSRLFASTSSFFHPISSSLTLLINDPFEYEISQLKDLLVLLSHRDEICNSIASASKKLQKLEV